MENLRQQFKREAVESLNDLLNELSAGAPALTDARKREAFRLLHTVKGTAQTFGFDEASRLAHELETLLAADENSDGFFREGIELLIKSLTETDFHSPQSYVEKIHRAVSDSLPASRDDYSSIVPNEIYSQLSVSEKAAFRAARRDGANLYGLEISFGLSDFAEEFINFRDSLSAAGEIIATFPSRKFDAAGKVGFQILLASAADASQIERFGADAVIKFPAPEFSNDIGGALLQAVAHGEAIAKKFGKCVEFEIERDEKILSPQRTKLVFDVMLHLVRNAVDHAFESKGKIKISLRSEEKSFRLIVADDGCGVDLQRIKAKAVEKNLISSDQILTERETIDLIFAAGFSTKSDVTEISGRGVGLDAVKHLIEKNGGRINVRTKHGQGAAFEIFLPPE